MANVLDLPAVRNTDASLIRLDYQVAPGRPHTSLDQVRSFVVQLSEPLDQGRVQDWFSYVIMRHTERLLRYKGLLNIHGLDARVVVQGVHSMIEVTTDRAWLPQEVRKTTVVFIGKDLPERDIREGLGRCVATEQSAARAS